MSETLNKQLLHRDELGQWWLRGNRIFADEAIALVLEENERLLERLTEGESLVLEGLELLEQKKNQYDALDDHAEKLMQRNNSLKFDVEATLIVLSQRLTELPQKIMQFDSFMDTEELKFPLHFPVHHEQDEWFEKFHKRMKENVVGIIDGLIEELDLNNLEENPYDEMDQESFQEEE